MMSQMNVIQDINPEILDIYDLFMNIFKKKIHYKK
jgi:hypothetical protein